MHGLAGGTLTLWSPVGRHEQMWQRYRYLFACDIELLDRDLYLVLLLKFG